MLNLIALMITLVGASTIAYTIFREKLPKRKIAGYLGVSIFLSLLVVSAMTIGSGMMVASQMTLITDPQLPIIQLQAPQRQLPVPQPHVQSRQVQFQIPQPPVPAPQPQLQQAQFQVAQPQLEESTLEYLYNHQARQHTDGFSRQGTEQTQTFTRQSLPTPAPTLTPTPQPSCLPKK